MGVIILLDGDKTPRDERNMTGKEILTLLLAHA